MVSRLKQRRSVMCTGTRLALILKHADRTLQHKPLSTTECQRIALMNVGSLTEIRGDSINSGHSWSEKRRLSTWMGTSKKKLPMRYMFYYFLPKMHLGAANVP